MNGGFGEFGHVATKPVLCAVRDFVGGPKVQAGIDCDAGLGVELVTDPTQLDRVDANDAGSGDEGLFGLIHERRIDSVEQPAEYFSRGSLQDDEDRDGDQQANDGVGQGEPGKDTDRAEGNGQ